MKLIMHGAGQEVGRSCIEVINGDRRFLLDAGLKITPENPQFPTSIQNLSEIQATFVSHIHLDHTGALPRLYSNGLRSPIYMSPLTKSLLKILLKDSWKVSRIEKFEVGYKKSDIFDVNELVLTFDEDKSGYSETQLAGVFVKTYNAGHVPGARSLLLEFEDTSLLYTGDFNTIDTSLTKGLDTTNYPKDVDVMIVESTYGDKDHPDRSALKEEFYERISSTLDQGGSVLIPTFSIGRAQELLIDITQRFNVPIFFDGMAKRIAENYTAGSVYLENKAVLRAALDKAIVVQDPRDRDDTKNGQSIIITTSGMMDGGPVLHYLPRIAEDEKSALLLTGYQAEQTNGRRLLEKGYVYVDEKKVKVKSYVKHFDFSAHAGMSEIHKVIDAVNPKHVVLNHGDHMQAETLYEYLTKKGVSCFMPKTGEELEIQ